MFSTTSFTFGSDCIISATVDAGAQYISQGTVAIMEQRDFSRYSDPGKSHTKCPANSRPVTCGVPSEENRHTSARRIYITDVTAYGSGSKKFIAFVIVSQSTSAQAKVTPKVGVDIVNI